MDPRNGPVQMQFGGLCPQCTDSALVVRGQPTQEMLKAVLEGVMPKLSEQRMRYLDGLFSREEIRKDVFDMASMKAPGKGFSENWVDRVIRSGPSLTYLFFADDNMLFSRATTSDCEALKMVMDIYENAYGRIVNLSKSSLRVSPSMSHSDSIRLAAVLGVRVVASHERLSLHWVLKERAIVNQLITLSGNWDAGKIKANFMKEDTVAILGLLMGLSRMEDSVIWHYELHGLYSVKSGYWLRSAIVDVPSSSGLNETVTWWKFLWRIIFPLKACRSFNVVRDSYSFGNKVGPSMMVGIGIMILEGFVMAASSQRIAATYTAQVAEAIAIYRGVKLD
ncbi:hypothetical protein Ddye_021476 [Dipteronia dyeriana]|uniref:Reverse transcriptase domain-containing protein n=1 Tax=Dipteronia dyeriana TaxID=168575 RepID=A0AAD9U2I1_9ROSI|nr:hypothetical protein Ddye_021476 [Dipteronia dyeriana]